MCSPTACLYYCWEVRELELMMIGTGTTWQQNLRPPLTIEFWQLLTSCRCTLYIITAVIGPRLAMGDWNTVFTGIHNRASTTAFKTNVGHSMTSFQLSQRKQKIEASAWVGANRREGNIKPPRRLYTWALFSILPTTRAWLPLERKKYAGTLPKNPPLHTQRILDSFCSNDGLF